MKEDKKDYIKTLGNLIAKVGLFGFLGATLLPSVFGSSLSFRTPDGEKYSVNKSFLTLTATSLSAGNNNLTDSNFNVSEAQLQNLKITSTSTDYDIAIYPDDTFTSGEELLTFEQLSETEILNLDGFPYKDDDSTNEFHIKITDNDGTNTFNLTLRSVR